VPTIAEAALPGFAATTWYGLFAGAATPRHIIVRLHADAARALKSPEVVERLTRDGSDPVGSEPAVFDAYVRTEIEKARRIVRASGMRID
jgi:tripartite-type tricarboxylate transporter receptor subunit TctC